MAAKHNSSFCPRVEALEDRTVMSTVSLTSTGVLKIVGNESSEAIVLRQGNGVISIQGMSGGVRQTAVKSVYIDAGGGNDTVDVRTLLVPCTVYGGAGNDYILGGEANDYLVGGDGNDAIFGMGGNDQLFGGNGNDRLLGGNGTNYLTGGAGTDFFDGGTHGFVANENDGAADFIGNKFAANNVYSANHVTQASQSYTCAFLSTLAGMARTGVNMGKYITYRGYDNYGVGQYDVSLWNGRQWVAVRVQFDGTTNETDARPTADYASWVIIMNRAWERFHGNSGASPADCLFALGRKPTTIYQNQMSFGTIQTALARGYVVAAGTGARPTMSNLVDNHAYTVVQAVVSNGVAYVQVRNPWGYDGGKGSDGNTSDALIWIPWNHFVASMYAVVIG